MAVRKVDARRPTSDRQPIELLRRPDIRFSGMGSMLLLLSSFAFWTVRSLVNVNHRSRQSNGMNVTRVNVGEYTRQIAQTGVMFDQKLSAFAKRLVAAGRDAELCCQQIFNYCSGEMIRTVLFANRVATNIYIYIYTFFVVVIFLRLILNSSGCCYWSGLRVGVSPLRLCLHLNV